MAFNKDPPTIFQSSPFPTKKFFNKFLIWMLLNLLILIILLIILYDLKKENKKLNGINHDFSNKLNMLTNKNSDLQINLKEMGGFYDRCLDHSKKIDKKFKKTKYFHHMLKQRSKKFIENLNRKINSFQLQGGNCDLLTIVKNTYDKFKGFFNTFYEKNSN